MTIIGTMAPLRKPVTLLVTQSGTVNVRPKMNPKPDQTMPHIVGTLPTTLNTTIANGSRVLSTSVRPRQQPMQESVPPETRIGPPGCRHRPRGANLVQPIEPRNPSSGRGGEWGPQYVGFGPQISAKTVTRPGGYGHDGLYVPNCVLLGRHFDKSEHIFDRTWL